jgi:23S rRNA (cytidine1920-2'-O)/16S rRNA (cytidine1409-2'-O)-methyltransferase
VTLAKRARLDTELARRKLVPSRAAAQRAIEDGLVIVDGIPASNSTTLVARDVPIRLVAREQGYVSRGGDKLDGALQRLEIDVAGRRWLDAGASTGGFTDRLLAGGATGVIALDVGYGQLDYGLRNDPRVVVMERKNVRSLTPSDLPWVPDGVTADLSFISLRLVLPALREVAAPDADFVLLVKPQFEVGRTLVGKGGVVRNPEHWRSAIAAVVESADALGLGLCGATFSDVVGPKGNREFFVHMRAGCGAPDDTIDRAVKAAP